MPEPWYKQVIQAVGDVVLGRRYWRKRAQAFEAAINTAILVQDLISERDEAVAQNSYLRLMAGDLRLDLRWFEECKKAYAEADKYKRLYVATKGNTKESNDEVRTGNDVSNP
jgi:hypothetical protein